MEEGGAAPGAVRVRVKVEPAGREHERGHVLEAAQCPEDGAVVIKEEAVLAKQELYTDHEVWDELVLGPVCLQERAACSETEVTVKLEPGSVDQAEVKEEPECGSETAGSSGGETEQLAQHSERLHWPTLNGELDRKIESNDDTNKKKISKKKTKENNAAYIRKQEKANARKRKFLDNMTTEQRENKRAKDREYYHKKKVERKIKSITDMTEREKWKQRKQWKNNSEKYRQKKKSLANTLNNTPSDSENENIPSVRSSHKIAGRKVVRKDRAKTYRSIEKKSIQIKRLQRTVDRLRKQLERDNKSPRLTLTVSNSTHSTPNTKTKS